MTVIENETQHRATAYLEAEAQRVRTTTQAAVEEVLLNSILDVLQYTERLSVWFLAITGASIPLLLSNADSVLKLISADRLRLSLMMLVASGLCGVFAKTRDMQIQVWRHMHRSFLAVLPAILERHNEEEERVERTATFLGIPSPEIELTPEHILNVVLEVAPALYRRRIRKAAATQSGDPLILLKGAIRSSYLQAVALVGQVAFFSAAAIVIAWFQ